MERFLFIHFLMTLAKSPGNVELEERYQDFFLFLIKEEKNKFISFTEP